MEDIVEECRCLLFAIKIIAYEMKAYEMSSGIVIEITNKGLD